jgi:hypothetical protein
LDESLDKTKLQLSKNQNQNQASDSLDEDTMLTQALNEQESRIKEKTLPVKKVKLLFYYFYF